VLVRPIGHTLYVMPPYVFDAAQARWLGEQLFAALNEVTAQVTEPEPEVRRVA